MHFWRQSGTRHQGQTPSVLSLHRFIPFCSWHSFIWELIRQAHIYKLTYIPVFIFLSPGIYWILFEDPARTHLEACFSYMHVCRSTHCTHTSMHSELVQLGSFPVLCLGCPFYADKIAPSQRPSEISDCICSFHSWCLPYNGDGRSIHSLINDSVLPCASPSCPIRDSDLSSFAWQHLHRHLTRERGKHTGLLPEPVDHCLSQPSLPGTHHTPVLTNNTLI